MQVRLQQPAGGPAAAAGKVIFLWGITSQVTYIGISIINLLAIFIMKIDIPDYTSIVIAFSAFIINLMILISTLKYKETQPETLVESAG